MANLWYTLNTTKLFPELPVERSEEPTATVAEMLAGNRRAYVRPVARRASWTLTLSDASEAEWAAWRAAAQDAQVNGRTLTEPDGTTHTVRCVAFSDPISRTLPSTDGSATATGPAWRDLTMELETL